MTRKYTPLLFILAALLATIGIGGCGGGEGTAVASIPRDQFAKRADLICEKTGEEQIEAAGPYLSRHPGMKELKLIELVAFRPLEKEIRKLKSLPLPSGHEQEAQAFLKALPKALAELKAEPSRGLPNGDDPFDHANKLGERIGLGDCSRNP